jgi:hypothetical protein
LGAMKQACRLIEGILFIGSAEVATAPPGGVIFHRTPYPRGFGRTSVTLTFLKNFSE